VRSLIVGASDVGDTPVGGEDDDGGLLALEGPVEEGETLHVEHVHLVDEEDARHDLGLALLPPLGHLLVDLVPHLLLDLSRVAGEEGQEPLRPGIDDVNFVEGDGVHDLLPLFDLPLRTLDKSRLRSHGVVITGLGEGPSGLGDSSRGLINRDHISRHDLLLLDSLDHLITQIVNSFHFRGL